MNCGFEDCRILDNLLTQNERDIKKCFEDFSKMRKPNGDGVQDLSMHNFIVMRDRTLPIQNFYYRKKLKKSFLICIQKNGLLYTQWLVSPIYLTRSAWKIA